MWFKKNTLVLFLILSIFSGAMGQLVTSEVKTFVSASLKKQRAVLVMKPRSCSEENPCPVLIFLPGWGMSFTGFIGFATYLSDLISQGKVQPMIVVVPDGLGGAGEMNEYWNSSVNGLFGDYIAKDLVEWITQRYPVCKVSDGQHERGYWLIGGFSMGGDGCSRLALTHPDVFSGFFAWSGDLNGERYREWFDYVNKYECPTFNYGTLTTATGFYTQVLWYSGCAFNPDPDSPNKTQFPLEQGTGAVRDSVFAKWMEVSPITMARNYFVMQKNPWHSMHIFVAAGAPEPFVSFFEFTKDFSDSLFSWGVNHEYLWHNHGHYYDETTTLQWADRHFAPRIKLHNDVAVYSCPENETLMNMYVNAAYVPKVMLQNLGIDTTGTVTVTCTIDKSGIVIFADTTTVDSLAYMQSIQVNFEGVRDLEQGDYNVTFTTVTINDENSTNNKFSTLFKVSELFDDFELGLRQWKMNGSWGIVPANPHSGQYSLNNCPTVSYDNNVNQSIESRSGFDLSSLSGAALTFWTRHRIEKDADFGYVEVSTDSGQTWQQVGVPCTGNESKWKEVTYSLYQFCGPGFTDVRIRFRFTSNETVSNIGWFIDDVSLRSVDTAVQDRNLEGLPLQFRLFENYPNPFNARTVITYQIGCRCHVKVQIFNMMGQEVDVLTDRLQESGQYSVIWDGKDHIKRDVPSGVYLYKIQAGNFSESKKMLLLR